jgi:hypothetical protein
LTSSSWVVTSARRRRWMVWRLVSARNSGRSGEELVEQRCRGRTGRRRAGASGPGGSARGRGTRSTRASSRGTRLPVPVATAHGHGRERGGRARQAVPAEGEAAVGRHPDGGRARGRGGGRARCRSRGRAVGVEGLEGVAQLRGEVQVDVVGDRAGRAATDAGEDRASSVPSGWSSNDVQVAVDLLERPGPRRRATGWARTEPGGRPARAAERGRGALPVARRRWAGRGGRRPACRPARRGWPRTTRRATASADSFRISVNGPTFLGRDIGTVHPSAVPAPAERRG